MRRRIVVFSLDYKKWVLLLNYVCIFSKRLVVTTRMAVEINCVNLGDIKSKQSFTSSVLGFTHIYNTQAYSYPISPQHFLLGMNVLAFNLCDEKIQSRFKIINNL